MWPHCSHILTPLTELTGKGKIVSEARHQVAYNQMMKALVALEAMLNNPDHNIPFEIYTDASKYQLSSVIMQNSKPVAYYSSKLNSAQKNYLPWKKYSFQSLRHSRSSISCFLGHMSRYRPQK
jgi:hypothetical protein